jgi:hypothetical protein
LRQYCGKKHVPSGKEHWEWKLHLIQHSFVEHNLSDVEIKFKEWQAKQIYIKNNIKIVSME